MIRQCPVHQLLDEIQLQTTPMSTYISHDNQLGMTQWGCPMRSWLPLDFGLRVHLHLRMHIMRLWCRLGLEYRILRGYEGQLTAR